MNHLEIQIRTTQGWEEIGEVRLIENERLGPNTKSEFCYDIGYATKYAELDDSRAVSCLAPVTFEPLTFDSWPPFLLDLFPQGAALRYVVDHYRIADREENYWRILSKARLNPPGNLRVVVEGTKALELENRHPGFTREDVIAKGADFLEYMIKKGAPVAGTTGAGGAAPKFLLREDKDGMFHADGALADDKTKVCWLVKFPRGRHQMDSDILRAEKVYYDLAREMGLATHEPLEWQDDCLFMHRFDRILSDQSIEYLGLESMYSAIGHPGFGSRLQHETYLDAIAAFSSEPAEDMVEYTLRDLLNRMMGNTDNHGRNQSLWKGKGWVRLAPLYDFAPMKFDKEGIVRNTRWQTKIEDHGIDALGRLLVERYGIDESYLNEKLRAFATRTVNLGDKMRATGVPALFVEGTAQERDMIQTQLKPFYK